MKLDLSPEPIRAFKVRRVVEVLTVRGRGVDGDDPVRHVKIYFDAETGEHLATVDEFAAKGFT